MQILNQRQITQKINRLAIEILENNYDANEIILAGINNNGMSFARMVYAALDVVTGIPLILTQIKLDPALPLSEEVRVGIPLEMMHDKVVILVDDVANTGRTIFYAFKPLMNIVPKKVEVAVLVDRTHKSFPVQVDYVGLSLATTLKENIEVQLRDVQEPAVFLN